ncbi:MAG: 3'-5' exonuclease [Bacteroidota bacterium]|nr:3'-5' exonuclease [Bacteroidota bacterium]
MFMTFTAIDFETAICHHICSVGIVCVENGIIVDEYLSLVRPPDNYYDRHTIQVHGITAAKTANAPTFDQVYPEIEKRLKGRMVVAHNESFDRPVLQKLMADYGFDYADLDLSDQWECTYRIYSSKGFSPAGLGACCEKLGITLNHHEALSDARACAELYRRYIVNQL